MSFGIRKFKLYLKCIPFMWKTLIGSKNIERVKHGYKRMTKGIPPKSSKKAFFIHGKKKFNYFLSII